MGETLDWIEPYLLALTPEQVGTEFRNRFCRPEVGLEEIGDQLRVWNTILDAVHGEPLPTDPQRRWLIESAFHITRWLQHELAERSDAMRDLARHAHKVGHRLELMLRKVSQVADSLVVNSAQITKIMESITVEGFQLTPLGVFTTPGYDYSHLGADLAAIERRRAQLESELVRLANEGHAIQMRTTAYCRTQLGADERGIPSIILESQRLGIDTIEPFRIARDAMPDSPLRDAFEQYVTDAELAQRLIDDPTSNIEPYRVCT
ncbi:hypothetical protein [Nocardia lasii]|uniref:Uncharacterized protein n=1 Tax=Nocardia lasii TaxID=1616107 RepID=A0ABW1JWA5_9NOCA